MLVEESEFPDGGENGGGEGGVLESKDNLERGRAQQEASEGGIQKRASTGGTILRLSKLYLQEAQTVLRQNVASHNVCVT
jgi:hypothetical protein